MQLESIDFIQNLGKKNEWRIENFNLGKINLIVGLNASGKTKTLGLINSLGNLLSENKEIHYNSAYFKVLFKEKNKRIDYKLHYEDFKVKTEELSIDGKVLLKRSSEKNKKDEIFFKKENKSFEFQVPEKRVAVVARRDSIQHDFLEYLYKWGENVRLYNFGGDLGRNSLYAGNPFVDKIEPNDLKQTLQVLPIYYSGNKNYSKVFNKLIINDMEKIGYKIEEIGFKRPSDVLININQQLITLYVKERDLDCKTEQLSTSQGMFRVLSLLIQLNYSKLTEIPCCLLVDDIGEGLDFERSKSLIKLLIDKIKTTNSQLIMSTNDRFVMNNIPLEYWSIIIRKGNKSKFINYRNSKKIFDDFDLKGLSNFDLFSSKYYLKKH